ncbi:hypothetical protein BD410DRAFT_866167 [Rickenella mellea]|uniref:Uncharacterized protein n=1 Tax=Rickenella mellea TaxID=50990 RepID=A0A4Y7Q4C9_9AGAM|nr:hypothetical protein BD410DRAFT_866167 [Rickenella mellea]
MPLISASIDAFLATSLLTIVPWFYISVLSSSSSSPSPSASSNSSSQNSSADPNAHGAEQATPNPNYKFRKFLTSLVILHTLFILYNFIVCAPFNLFATLRLPLGVSSEVLRGTLVRRAGLLSGGEGGKGALPRALEELIARLGSFEARTLYVRFGHTVLQDCIYCHTPNDFALYALPRPLLEYVRELAVVGLVTIRGSGRERWRPWGLGAVLGAAGVEAYWVVSAEIGFGGGREGRGGNVVMWHDQLWRLRQLLFLLLPILLHHLPASPPSPPPLLARLPAIAAILEATYAKTKMLGYTRAATMRVPALREGSVEWWERERREEAWGVGDEGVREMAGRVGMGFGEGERRGDVDGEEVGDGEGGEGVEGEVGELRRRVRVMVDALVGAATSQVGDI